MLSRRKDVPRAFRLGVAVVAVAIGCVLGLAFAEGAARVVAPHWREYASVRFMTQETSPDGSTLAVGRAGFDGYFAQNNGDFRVRIRLNDAGLRNDEPAAAAAGHIWAVGDSFTFGWGVEANQMFSAVLGLRLDEKVYNVAAPGGDVQSYQRLIERMPKGVTPRLVVVGLTIENDLNDYLARPSVNSKPERPLESASFSFKEWGTNNSAVYNLAAVAVKQSPSLRTLFVKIGLIESAHGFRAAPDRRAADRLSLRTAEEIVRLRNMLPSLPPLVVLVIPSRFEILDQNPEWTEVRHAAVAALKARNVPVVDPTAALMAAGFQATHFLHDGHWSARGHEVAGTVLAGWISAHHPAGSSKPK